MSSALDPLAIGTLGGHGVVLMVGTLIVFTLFVWDRLPIASICLAILAVVPLLFELFPLTTAGGATVDPLRFFAGFAHPALVAICGLMVLGQGLVVTGALEPAARRLADLVARRPALALLAVLVVAGGISGLVNDTPVVVLLIPLIIAAGRRAKMSPASLLLPMNYAVLIGGMATAIGTSTNLIVVAIAASLGVGPFGLFDFYGIVMLAAVPALAYLWLIAPRMLSTIEGPGGELATEVFDAEFEIQPDDWLDGRALHEALKATGGRMRVLDVRRGGRSLSRLPTLKLKAGDVVTLQDTVANLKEYESALKASLHGVDTGKAKPAPIGLPDEPEPKAKKDKGDDKDAEGDDRRPASIVAQFVITPQSPLAGRTVRQERLADRYDLAVVGLRPAQPRSPWQREQLADRRLGPGDLLLIQGSNRSIEDAQRDGIGLLLDSRYVIPRQHKAAAALVTMAVVVVLAATKLLPIALAALGGVLALLALRVLNWHDIAQSLSTKVVLLVAASLALGDALEVSGATAFLAAQFAEAGRQLHPGWLLALLMALMGLLTNFVSNNAAAAIGTPLGIELARALGVPPEPFVLAVMFGCNLCYLTPMGYQTNLLVMNAAGYRFGDFVRVGAPLFVLMWAALSYLLVHRYGL